MKSFLPVTALTLFLGAAPMAPAQSTPDLAAEKAGVEQVLENLDKALMTEDIDLYSKQIAQDSLQGFGVGSQKTVKWEEMKSALLKKWTDIENGSVKNQDRNIQIGESGNVAWFSELFDYSFTQQGKTVQLNHVRTTGVLEKRNGQWLVVQIHSSFPLPTK